MPSAFPRIWRSTGAGSLVGHACGRLARFATVLAFALGLALAQPGVAPPERKPERSAELRHTHLNAVVTSRLFSSINRSDAVASISTWFQIVGKDRGFLLDSKVEVLESVTEIRQRLLSKSIDIVIFDFRDFMQLESSGLIVPALVGSPAGGAGPLYSYLVLVNPSSPAKSIADLQGKNVLYYSRNESNLAAAWVDVILARQKLGRAASFFATSKTVLKPQACILPLFFGTVDACVIDETNLDLIKEMNPQVGRLRILDRSTPMLEHLIGTTIPDHPHRQELLDALLHLHQDPRGSQLLMVFKAKCLLPAQPEYFQAARALWQEYNRLPGVSPQKTAGSKTPPASAPESGQGRN